MKSTLYQNISQGNNKMNKYLKSLLVFWGDS